MRFPGGYISGCPVRLSVPSLHLPRFLDLSTTTMDRHPSWCPGEPRTDPPSGKAVSRYLPDKAACRKNKRKRVFNILLEGIFIGEAESLGWWSIT